METKNDLFRWALDDVDPDVHAVDVMGPGEWENDDGPKDWYAVCDAEGIKAYAGDKRLANLIASAPDLLEALQSLVTLYDQGQITIDGDSCEGDDPCIYVARAAIRKATGE